MTSSSTSTMFPVSKRIAHFSQDVCPLALHCQAINLGQGFPNFKSPTFIKEAARNAVYNDVNQYSPPKGLPRLRKALSENLSPLFNRHLDPEKEIIVTAGANEGMFAIFQAFLNDGDEVICFEPFFDQYAPNITMSGGRLVYCPLRPPQNIAGNISSREWKLDFGELESKITSKTKMIILNTPHNPVGKVFNRKELEQLSSIVKKHEIILISDEVYERLVYDEAQHLRIATFPDMWERTITVGSAGKSFCITGWRVGWLVGPSHLLNPSLIAHSRIVFCTNAPLQDAIASGFEQLPVTNFFDQQLKEYIHKRDFLVSVFSELGLPVTIPEGSYFILVNIEKIKVPEKELEESGQQEIIFCNDGKLPPRSKDWEVCRWLTTHIGVASIPPSEFYGPENAHLAEKYARFCFCKTQETLEEAKVRLQKLKNYIQ